jgi:hypothetical protein
MAFVASMLAACSGPALKPVQLVDTTVLGPFAPTQLLINPRTSYPRFYESRIDYLNKCLVETKAFRALGSRINSPIVIEATLDRGSDENIGQQTAQVLSAATLFLVPAPINLYNSLTVDMYVNGALVKHFEYRENYATDTGIYNMPKLGTDKDPEFLAIRNLAYRFVNDVERESLLPRSLD